MKNASNTFLLIIITAFLGILASDKVMYYISQKHELRKIGNSIEKEKLERKVSGEQLKIDALDGGSVTTPLSYDIKVNPDSSLRRQWVVINDNSCPIIIKSTGITTVYKPGTSYSLGEYSLVSKGQFETKEDIKAVNINYVLFDVLGYHMRTLGNLEIEDIKAGQVKDLAAEWYADEHDVQRFLSVVSFVSDVLTESGKIWRNDDELIGKELIKLRLQYIEGIFSTQKGAGKERKNTN